MGVPFDHIASPYDSVFVRTAIGKLQRKRVWKYIESVIPQLSGYEMLELNYGNDEDADLFGETGYSMLATDIGSETIKVTFDNPGQYSMNNRISSHYMDIENFDETLFDKKFDLVFSNFGGINCINPQSLKALIQKLPSILKPGGRFIGVIMPKFCLWETMFFSLRFQFRKAFRRLTSHEVLTDIYGVKQKTWFYHPSQLASWSKEKFNLISLKPVGMALPPFSLNDLFRYKKRVLFYLNATEKALGELRFLSGMADHYVIDLELRK